MISEAIQITAVTFEQRGVRIFAEKVARLLNVKGGLRHMVRGLHLEHLKPANKGDLVVIEDTSSGIEVLAKTMRERIGDAAFPVVSLYTASSFGTDNKRDVKKIDGDEQVRGVYRDSDFLPAVSEALLLKQ